MGREVVRAALTANDITIAGALEAAGHAANGGTLRDLGFESDAPVRGELAGLGLAGGAPAPAQAGRPVMIEFCGAEGFFARAREAAAAGLALVSGSTGLGDEAQKSL